MIFKEEIRHENMREINFDSLPLTTIYRRTLKREAYTYILQLSEFNISYSANNALCD